MNKDEKFWDKIAQKYSKQAIADEAAYQKKIQVTRDYFKPDMDVLEVGCGTGSTAIAHAPYVKHIRAIDVSSKMIEIAQAKATASHVENVTFEHAAICDLMVDEQCVDVVLALSILHLLEDKDVVVRKLYKMLKPGGVLVTSTICLGDTMKFFKFIVPVGRLFGFMPLVKVFTSNELEACLTDAGFRIEYQWQPKKGQAVFIVAKKGA